MSNFCGIQFKLNFGRNSVDWTGQKLKIYHAGKQRPAQSTKINAIFRGRGGLHFFASDRDPDETFAHTHNKHLRRVSYRVFDSLSEAFWGTHFLLFAHTVFLSLYRVLLSFFSCPLKIAKYESSSNLPVASPRLNCHLDLF